MTASRTVSGGSDTTITSNRQPRAGRSGRRTERGACAARGRIVAPARRRPGTGAGTGTSTAAAAVAGFFRGVRGAAAVETVFSIFVRVTAFAGLMSFVANFYAEDGLDRAARTAARSLAIKPDADPWEAVWQELDPNVDFTTCGTDWTAAALGTCDGLTLAVVKGVSAAALAAAIDSGTPAPADPAGELVLVGLSRSSSGFIPGVANANANPPPNPSAGDVVRMDGVGVARSEPEPDA